MQSLKAKLGRSNKGTEPSSHRFTVNTLRGNVQPDLSKKMFKIIKTENYVVNAHESAAKERIAIASQISEWGEATGDDAISDISDKAGVLYAEMGEQEQNYAEQLEEYRALLKAIRNTESSIQPSIDHKAKLTDEIAKLKYKEPESPKLVQLEQELVRAEAESLVGQAQLTNITRQKFKQALDVHTAAIMERAEKQIILAKHMRELVSLLDDTPVVPGDERPLFEHEARAHGVLTSAESELKSWQPSHKPVHIQSQSMNNSAMPASTATSSMPTEQTGSTVPVGNTGSAMPASHSNAGMTGQTSTNTMSGSSTAGTEDMFSPNPSTGMGGQEGYGALTKQEEHAGQQPVFETA